MSQGDEYRPSIKSLFYAEFDNTEGPRILYQIPEEYVSTSEFDAVSEYVIPKQNLSGRVTCVHLATRNTPIGCPDWMMGNPICLSHCKYPRNALLFNICILLDGDTQPSYFRCYESVVQKLARYFAALEIERDFLSNPTSKPSIPKLLNQVYEDLNQTSSCRIGTFLALDHSECSRTAVDECNTWHLRLEPVWNQQPPELTQIHDHAVPVPLADLRKFVSKEWDLVIQAIAPHINGSNYVKRVPFSFNS